ncbi:hypothetical protein [Actinacidiphila rubida]|uniref:Uncharacterized protein n=1 Tax=Actinacidiphila rubida TaxID=310780 RepID=A0A1H8IZS8_9ACTN|nr:hypothetical protein [Actinacidiphila rubida]SEN74240.1 hypothetical protein SAMN05216267_100992 [Actinacidiphila rubida]
MPDQLTAALSGQAPTALAEDVSLATPLAAPRITGRDAVSAALGTYHRALAGPEATARLKGDEVEGVVHSAGPDGRSAEIVALARYNAAGLIATIDVYGRPWPFMAALREDIAKLDPALADPDLGAGPYVPEGPVPVWVDHPAVPPLAQDVILYSPILSEEPTGKAVVGPVLEAAARSFTDLKVRAVLGIEGRAGFAVVIDEYVDRHVQQLVEVFTLDDEGEVAELRIFTRPWLVTAHFRKRMYALLKDTLGPEYWEGPDPRGPLPTR